MHTFLLKLFAAENSTEKEMVKGNGIICSQPVFYGLQLLSATRAFGVDCRVELVGVSLEQGGVTGS